MPSILSSPLLFISIIQQHHLYILHRLFWFYRVPDKDLILQLFMTYQYYKRNDILILLFLYLFYYYYSQFDTSKNNESYAPSILLIFKCLSEINSKDEMIEISSDEFNQYIDYIHHHSVLFEGQSSPFSNLLSTLQFKYFSFTSKQMKRDLSINDQLRFYYLFIINKILYQLLYSSSIDEYLSIVNKLENLIHHLQFKVFYSLFIHWIVLLSIVLSSPKQQHNDHNKEIFVNDQLY